MVAIFGGVFFVILAGIIYAIASNVYHGMVNLRRDLDKAWKKIELVLRDRHAEVASIVQVIEKHSPTARPIIEKINEAKTREERARNLVEKIAAANDFSNALKSLLVSSISLPELKSNSQITLLRQKLATLDDEAGLRKDEFNKSAANYNLRISQFPDMFFADAMGYSPLPEFKLCDDEHTLATIHSKAA